MKLDQDGLTTNSIAAPGSSGAMNSVRRFFQRQAGIFSRNQMPDFDRLPDVVGAVLGRRVSYYEEMRSQAASGADAAPLTNVAFILDKSGSMQAGKGTTIEGFNEQVRVVREGAREAGETTFTEVQFSTEVEVRSVAGDLAGLAPLSHETYKPDGTTALYDALGDTVAALLQTPRIWSRTTGTLVTLFTDGEENASRRYRARDLRDLIQRLEATGRWTFALVGPHGGVTDLGRMLSVKPANIASYDPTDIRDLRAAFRTTRIASADFMCLRSRGITQADALFRPSGKDEPAGSAGK